MTKEIWLNLPVKNVAASKAFFEKIGFSFNEQQTTEHSACMVVGSKKTVVMLFAEPIFVGFTGGAALSDASKSAEILISFDAESRAEVDEIAQKAAAAGGSVFGKPSEIQGWMYGCGFADLDGHRWNALFMDFEKLPKN